MGLGCLINAVFEECLVDVYGHHLAQYEPATDLFAIGVPELLYAAAQIWSEVLNVREMMWVLLFTYVIIVAVLVFIMHRWERALRIPGYSA